MLVKQNQAASSLPNQVCISKSIPGDIPQDKAVILNHQDDLVSMFRVFAHVGVLCNVLDAALRAVIHNFQVAEPATDSQVLWVS